MVDCSPIGKIHYEDLGWTRATPPETTYDWAGWSDEVRRVSGPPDPGRILYCRGAGMGDRLLS